MKIYIATHYDRDMKEQELIGAFASKDIARRELLKKLTEYGDNADEIVDCLIEEGCWANVDDIIRFEGLSVSVKPKQVCVLASYYVADDMLTSYKLFSTEESIRRFCRRAVVEGELVNDLFYETEADYKKAVKTATEDMLSKMQETGSFYYDSAYDDPKSLCLSNWIDVTTE